MWAIVPSFPFAVLIAASQIKPDVGTTKIENTLFVGQNKNRPP
jgi:hypothetical protein